MSSSLILRLGISILPVSSLICLDITGVGVRSLCLGSGPAIGGSILIYLKIQKKEKKMKECNGVSYLLGMVSSALQAASFAGS